MVCFAFYRVAKTMFVHFIFAPSGKSEMRGILEKCPSNLMRLRARITANDTQMKRMIHHVWRERQRKRSTMKTLAHSNALLRQRKNHWNGSEHRPKWTEYIFQQQQHLAIVTVLYARRSKKKCNKKTQKEASKREKRSTRQRIEIVAIRKRTHNTP